MNYALNWAALDSSVEHFLYPGSTSIRRHSWKAIVRLELSVPPCSSKPSLLLT